MTELILTPWGEAFAVVERNQDGRWYAVLRDGQLRDVKVGGEGESAAAAVASLLEQCRRIAVPGDAAGACEVPTAP